MTLHLEVGRLQQNSDPEVPIRGAKKEPCRAAPVIFSLVAPQAIRASHAKPIDLQLGAPSRSSGD